MVPGEFVLGEGKIKCNANYPAITLKVKNTGDRAVQVGSHFHFYEANEALEFDRNKAWGKRLDIPAGTAIRFEAGDVKEVNLVDFGGKRRIFGFNDKVDGFLDGDKAPKEDADSLYTRRKESLELAKENEKK